MRIQLLLLLVVTSSLLGCGQGFETREISKSALECVDESCSDMFSVKPDKQFSVINFRQVLPNFKSCLGLSDSEVSSPTKTQVKALEEVFSKDSMAKSISAPMLMGITTTVAEFCQDLMKKENTLSERTFFKGYNLGNGQTAGSGSSEGTMTSFARACWGRSPRNEELNLIKNSMKSVNLDTVLNEKSGLFICASMLSSTEAFRF